jgi:hypothetical protein
VSHDRQTCPLCGAELPADAVFCTSCGARMAPRPATPPESPGAGGPAGPQDTVLEEPGRRPPRTDLPPYAAAPGAGPPPAVPPPPGGSRYGRTPAGAPPGQPLSGPPPSGQPVSGPAWPAAPLQSVVPPAPTAPVASRAAGGRGRPPWLLVAVIVVVIAAVAGGVIFFVLRDSGDGGSSDPSSSGDGGVAATSPSKSSTPSRSGSPSPDPSATALSDKEQLARFEREVQPIVKKWNKLENRLDHLLWKDAHKYADATWPPAGYKMRALTAGFNSITSALWKVDTPSFMQTALRDMLRTAHLEHTQYDKAAAMLIKMHWSNRAYRKMARATDAAWQAYLKKKKHEEQRTGLTSS